MTEVTVDGNSALKDFQEIPPPSFTHEKGGQYMLNMLSQRELWQKRPIESNRSDPILFLNLQSGRHYSFDGNTLNTQYVDDLSNNGEGFNGVILVTGPLDESDTEVTKKLTTGIASLKPGASVFLFEKPEDSLDKPQDFVDKNWRKELLKKLGLVEADVLNSGRSVPGSILWEAHMRRDGGLIEPINLLENGPKYVDNMIGKMKEKLRNQGWNVVDFENSELAKKLKSSKFPLKDIHAIRDGFGIKVKSNLCPTATCEGVIPIDTGNLEMINSCGENHNLIPSNHENTKQSEDEVFKKQIKPKDGETKILKDRNCFYCGEHLRAYYFREGKGPQKIQISCPHDGFVELKNA